ncbi:MAG: leucine-rich repeat protein [Raoultibacter sp.]
MYEKMIFQDSRKNLQEIIEHAKENPLTINIDDVHQDGPPKACAQEIWSPQLFPYESWTLQKTPDNQEEVGLFEAGFLGLGLGQEIREATLARATHKQALSDVFQTTAQHEPFLSVRLDEEGYTITGINLHAYEEHCGHKGVDVLIVIPQSIGKIPVTRIAASAFARRLVYGVDVRAVILPDGVTRVEQNAFAALCVRDLFISRSVQSMGTQEFSITQATRVAPSIAYHVDKDNPSFASHKGSLYSKDGTTLHFQAFPAPGVLTLPAGLQRIAAQAFVESPTQPEVIVCPDSLTHIYSVPNKDALWVCDLDSPLRRTLTNLGLSAVNPHYVRVQECYFDIMDTEEAQLVRSPRRCERLVIPSSVEGRPVTRIRAKALPQRVESLLIPPSVTVIEEKNTCSGLKELALPAHLQQLGAYNFLSRCLTHTVTLPASLTHIGRGCFENCICTFEACGCTVHISPNPELSCFIGQEAPAAQPDLYAQQPIPFDFERYDALLASKKHIRNKMDAVLERIDNPYRLCAAAQSELLAYLQSQPDEVMQQVARRGDVHLLEALCTCGFITRETIDAQAEALRSMRKMDCVLFLMDYRQQHFPTTVPAKRFAL